MRRSLLGMGVLLLLFSGPLEAQSRDAATLRRNYEEKLKKEFVSKVEWTSTLSAAKERARTERKPILGYFTRSYSP